MPTDDKHNPPTRAPEGPGVDAGRRRFARAGLGASAVLGVMHAKPVLASSGSVYHCTVSGHVSGNMSRVEIACDTLGDSPAEWLAEGDAPLSTAIFNVIFGGQFFFANKNPTGSAAATLSKDKDDVYKWDASLKQVLANTQAAQPYLLGKAAAASLLNATKLSAGAGLNYPLSELQVKKMFVAVFAEGGIYTAVAGANTVSWDRDKVTLYFRSLYEPVGF